MAILNKNSQNTESKSNSQGTHRFLMAGKIISFIFAALIIYVNAYYLYYIIPSIIEEIKSKGPTELSPLWLGVISLIGLVVIIVNLIAILVFVIKRKKTVILYALLLSVSVTAFMMPDIIRSTEGWHITDDAIIIYRDEISPESTHRLISYQYDFGAAGETRLWWAVLPYECEGLDLRGYDLPDGYKAIAWSDKNELLVQKWDPYYYMSDTVELNTGDIFKGVRIKIVPDKSRP
jgi:hypothetical protein